MTGKDTLATGSELMLLLFFVIFAQRRWAKMTRYKLKHTCAALYDYDCLLYAPKDSALLPL
ncbi:MAG: hypothetical protein Kow00121_41570 [Elainellaceae cyanobacterium]